MTIRQKNRLLFGGIALGILVAGWLFGTYVPVRETRKRHDNILFITGRNLWNTPLDRYVIWDDGSSLNGPVSSSGKRHGKWTYYNGDSYVEHSWYWYGEEVSEGEWHKLND